MTDIQNKELIEMVRIAFILPPKEYGSLEEVVKQGKQKYGMDRRFGTALENILLNYIGPRSV